jgi:fucose permease
MVIGYWLLNYNIAIIVHSSKHNHMSAASSPGHRGYLVPMIIVSGLFFIFGFVTWLNGILIPYPKIACQLSNFQALFVAFAFYISYTILALPSAWLLKRTGLTQ